MSVSMGGAAVEPGAWTLALEAEGAVQICSPSNPTPDRRCANAGSVLVPVRAPVSRAASVVRESL